LINRTLLDPQQLDFVPSALRAVGLAPIYFARDTAAKRASDDRRVAGGRKITLRTSNPER
jgi:hypothetical protein